MRIETFLSLYGSIRDNADRLDAHAHQIASGSFDINDLVGVLNSKKAVEINGAAIDRANNVMTALFDMLA